MQIQTLLSTKNTLQIIVFIGIHWIRDISCLIQVIHVIIELKIFLRFLSTIYIEKNTFGILLIVVFIESKCKTVFKYSCFDSAVLLQSSYVNELI